MKKVIKYRPHRAMLDEAMEEAREFNTIDEMKDHVYQSWNSEDSFPGCFDRDDIVIGEILGDDDRIGWKNVRHVCIKRMGKEKYSIPQCIGWCGE